MNLDNAQQFVMPRVQSLYLHPLKSGASLPVQELRVSPDGIERDRQWMLHRDGRMLTARSHPQMLTLQVTPLPTGVRMDWPGREPLVVNEADLGTDLVELTIWKREEMALEAPPPVNRWLSEALGEEVRLACRAPVLRTSPSSPGSFADSCPLLLCGSASLEELSSVSGLEGPLVQRFRPNILVETREPFEEESWEKLQVGRVILERVKACVRCVVITRDPLTGDVHPSKEPLRSLTDWHADQNGRPIFGVYFRIVGEGPLQVGQEIKTLSFRP